MLAWCDSIGKGHDVPTFTSRNVPAGIVDTLKALARRGGRSMEQEVRELLAAYTAERRSALSQIEKSWTARTRRPTAEEIDRWMQIGRP